LIEAMNVQEFEIPYRDYARRSSRFSSKGVSDTRESDFLILQDEFFVWPHSL